MSDFFQNYYKHVEERKEQGIPPLALSAEQAEALIGLLQDIPSGKDDELLDLLKNRINPGVDPAARVKADFLVELVKGSKKCKLVSAADAVEILGTMVGGYNLDGLIDALSSADDKLAPIATKALKNMVLAVNRFEDIQKLSKGGNKFAKEIIESWANGEWFTNSEKVPDEIKCVVYKVDGEINTDDFSPASFAFTRADIPLHSVCMGGSLFPKGPEEIAALQKKASLPIAFVGDVVGTGSSRKSACNSLLWHIGDEIPYIPNKKRGGVILGGIIAPIFF